MNEDYYIFNVDLGALNLTQLQKTILDILQVLH